MKKFSSLLLTVLLPSLILAQRKLVPQSQPLIFTHVTVIDAIVWIDPKKELIRIFLEHRFGFNNESNIFMAMAGAALTD
jgi:hypothetical protein